MKKIIIFLLCIAILGCSQNDSKSSESITNSDGAGGSLAIFVLKGNYLYSVDDSKLNVFSLVDPENPTFVNFVNVGFNIETLFSNGEYLFIGSRNGMFIYSVTNPENPTKLSSVQHFTACDPVVANATHSFVTLHSNTNCGNMINVLQVYNTTNPNQPQLVHSRNLVYPKGLALYGNYLFVCDDSIKIFNIANPTEPVLVKSIDKNCFDLIIKDNDLFAIGEKGLYRYLLDDINIQNIAFKSEIIF